MNFKSELYKIKFNNVDNNYVIIFKNTKSNKFCEFHVKNSDAKNIALANERIDSYRMKTYNLVFDFLNAFSIKVVKTNIFKQNGYVVSELVLNRKNKKIKMNASFIDSIILCIQSFSSIYINESLYDSINRISDKAETNNFNYIKSINLDQDKYDNDKIKNLEKTLKNLIDEENYESAAKIRDLINEYNKSKG